MKVGWTDETQKPEGPKTVDSTETKQVASRGGRLRQAFFKIIHFITPKFIQGAFSAKQEREKLAKEVATKLGIRDTKMLSSLPPKTLQTMNETPKEFLDKLQGKNPHEIVRIVKIHTEISSLMKGRLSDEAQKDLGDYLKKASPNMLESVEDFLQNVRDIHAGKDKSTALYTNSTDVRFDMAMSGCKQAMAVFDEIGETTETHNFQILSEGVMSIIDQNADTGRARPRVENMVGSLDKSFQPSRFVGEFEGEKLEKPVTVQWNISTPSRETHSFTFTFPEGTTQKEIEELAEVVLMDKFKDSEKVVGWAKELRGKLVDTMRSFNGASLEAKTPSEGVILAEEGGGLVFQPGDVRMTGEELDGIAAEIKSPGTFETTNLKIVGEVETAGPSSFFKMTTELKGFPPRVTRVQIKEGETYESVFQKALDSRLIERELLLVKGQSGSV